jgi:anti-sigma regulatory factor (Ser/Thr protein kinase)
VTTTDRPVEVEVPARVEYVRLVRMVVASLAGSRRDLDGDRVDDLRLAVSEACVLAVTDGEAARLLVSCREEPDSFVVDVHDGPREGDIDDQLAFALIRALVDEVTTVEEDGGTRLRLRVSCAPVSTTL